MEKEIGTLKDGEFHPSAANALEYLMSLGDRLLVYQEVYLSCAIEGNRHAEICGETLRRILHHEPVSDRYVLGLAWDIKQMEEKKEQE